MSATCNCPTARQAEILDCMKRLQQKTGKVPAMYEIADEIFLSKSGVFAHMQKMKAKGLITNIPGAPRTYEVIR